MTTNQGKTMDKKQFKKKYKRVIQFAQLNAVPNDHWLYQALAKANVAYKGNKITDAKKWLDKALICAQQYGTNPIV
jgi:hypothetical protein